MLENKLNLTSQVELARVEERLSKKRAKWLFESGTLDKLEVGTFEGLSDIHRILFEDIYDFAGKIREVNISKGNFRFAPIVYLHTALDHISKMRHKTFDDIVVKYVEMNVAHPFREGNGRAGRIWLDCMLKSSLGKAVDWNAVDKEAYLSAMQRSPINDLEIKYLLNSALTDDLSRESFMKGIDVSYFYEGYSEFKIEDL